MRGSLMRASNRTPGATSWPGSAALPAVSNAASNEASSRVFIRLRAILVVVCLQVNNIALLNQIGESISLPNGNYRPPLSTFVHVIRDHRGVAWSITDVM